MIAINKLLNTKVAQIDRLTQYIFYLRQSDAAIDIEPLPGNISAPVGKQMLSAMRREHGPEFSLLHQEDIRLRDLK